MNVEEIRKKVRSLCEGAGLQFFFAVPNASEWAVTDCEHLRKIVSYHKELETLPPVTPTQKWIPVSERLPKHFTFVNATCRSLVDDRENWVVETMYLPILKEDNEQGYSDWGDIPMLNWHEAEVVAWTERIIPEPYKADADQVEEMEKHTDRQIYDGCILLMQKMVDYFQEYLEYLGYDLGKLDEDERFTAGISNMEIVRQLFLQHTRNSGGCSTRDLCEKLGVDPYKSVKFEFDWYEEE